MQVKILKKSSGEEMYFDTADYLLAIRMSPSEKDLVQLMGPTEHIIYAGPIRQYAEPENVLWAKEGWPEPKVLSPQERIQAVLRGQRPTIHVTENPPPEKD